MGIMIEKALCFLGLLRLAHSGPASSFMDWDCFRSHDYPHGTDFAKYYNVKTKVKGSPADWRHLPCEYQQLRFNLFCMLNTNGGWWGPKRHVDSSQHHRYTWDELVDYGPEATMDYIQTHPPKSLAEIRWRSHSHDLQEIHINVSSVDVIEYYQKEWQQTAFVAGYIDMSWKDIRLSSDAWEKFYPRLRNKGCITFCSQSDSPVESRAQLLHCLRETTWNFTKIDSSLVGEFIIRKSNAVWMPDLFRGNYNNRKAVYADWSSGAAAEYHSNRHTTISSDGTVRTHMMFGLHSDFCKMNYRNFPFDKHQCCLNFTSYKFPKTVRFVSGKDGIKFVKEDTMEEWPNWKFLAGSVNVVQDSERSTLWVCIDVARVHVDYIYKLILPMAASSFVVILAPLFSPWFIQHVFKVLALLMFLFSFLLGSPWNTTHLGENVPKYMELYDFFIWTTAIYLVLGLVLWGLSKADRPIPPPHQFVVFARIVNSLFCCNMENVNNNTVAPMPVDSIENNPVSKPVGSGASLQWATCYIALNNCVMIIFVAVYILGACIIASS